MAPLVSPYKCNLAFTLLSIWNVSTSEDSPHPLRKMNKYTAGGDPSTYKGTHLCVCLHMANRLIPPTPLLSTFYMKLARKWVVCFLNWILYYYQIPNNSLLKRYCKNKAWKPAIKAVWSPRCCLLPSPEALEANVRKAKANLVKVALRNLTPQLCSEQQTCPVRFSRLRDCWGFPCCCHENQYFWVSLLAHDVKLNLDKLGSILSYTP